MAPITGTAGDDILYGTADNDLIQGLAGNDTLYGDSGNDTLNGGVGFDTAEYRNLGQAIALLPQGRISAGKLGGSDTLSSIERIVGATGQANTINASSSTGGASLTVNLGANSLVVNSVPGFGSLSFTVENFVNVTGTPINDTIYGNAANNSLSGVAGNDTLGGGNGNDVLDGGVGNDSMSGGTGNDRYGVDSTGDTITEVANAGADTVASTVNWTLAANLENLNLTGSSAINGYGNSLDNIINGNNANNSLSGGAGNDRLNGSSGNDTLSGGDGDDILSGGLGSNSMSGGTGNDRYGVDSTRDTITEVANAGADTVASTVNWALTANLENLNLTGSNAINGYGNSLNNIINGNDGNNNVSGEAGNDRLNGGEGNDTIVGGDGDDYLDADSAVGRDSMNGGTGNDRYFVDSTGDTVTENLNAGTDRVDSYVSYTLGANLETLALQGSSAINGYGNSLDNLIEGNNANDNLSGEAGNDRLNGGDGNDFLVGGNGKDTLTGGAGADRFSFSSPLEGIDTIMGFNGSEGDKIEVSASGFGGGLTTGSLSSSQFTIGAAAIDALDRFIYNSSTGGLFFDVDGVSGLGQTQIASLKTGLNLISSDISVI